MKTAVEHLGIAFRQWQKDWDNFNKTVENKPKSYDEFIKGENAVFKRTVTAYLIRQLKSTNQYTFDRTHTVKKLSLSLYNKVVSLNDYVKR